MRRFNRINRTQRPARFPRAASLPFFFFSFFSLFFSSSLLVRFIYEVDMPNVAPPRGSESPCTSRGMKPRFVPTAHQLHSPCKVVSLLMQSIDALVLSDPIRWSLHMRAPCASRAADRLWLDYEVHSNPSNKLAQPTEKTQRDSIQSLLPRHMQNARRRGQRGAARGILHVPPLNDRLLPSGD